MSKITYVFFDNDGVLLDTEKIVFDCNMQVMKEMGIEYSLQDFQETVMITHKGTRGFFSERGLNDRMSEFTERRNTIWNPQLEAGGHLIPGVIETLEKVKENYNIALTTSAKHEKFMKMSADCNLISYFEFGLFRDDCDKVKPHPEIYLKALEKAGVSSTEALVIEDTPRGIMAAKNAGIRVVAIPNAMTELLDTSMADFQLKSITELPDLLKKLQDDF